jgi:hypothetical protein
MRPIRYCIEPGCEAMVEGNTDKCATHNYEDRRNAKKARQVKVVHQVKKVSARRAKEKPIYDKLRDEQLKEHPECQIKIAGICIGRATECHHAAKRGKNYLNKETFLSACDPCHKHVERVMSAQERRDNGLLTTPTQTI